MSWASRSSAQALSLGCSSISMNGASCTSRKGKSPRPQASRQLLDHGGEEGAVLVGAAGVGLALVPDGPLEGEGDQRGIIAL